MIGIIYKNNNTTLKISGHAGYAERGKDIVCAAVTALACTLEKCIEKTGEGCCEWKKGETCFTATGTENLRPCFETVVTGLQLLAEEFPDYVNIRSD